LLHTPACHAWCATRGPDAFSAADAIDDEVPGSVRADVEPLVTGDKPFKPYSPGGLWGAVVAYTVCS
jgi:hypothetical protein